MDCDRCTRCEWEAIQKLYALEWKDKGIELTQLVYKPLENQEKCESLLSVKFAEIQTIEESQFTGIQTVDKPHTNAET